jgi:hypothetical protein
MSEQIVAIDPTEILLQTQALAVAVIPAAL